MAVPTERVVVICNTVGDPPEVYHRDFPEIRAQGESIDRAALGLSLNLERAIDSALTIWRRQSIEQAIAEVHAFIAERKDVHDSV